MVIDMSSGHFYTPHHSVMEDLNFDSEMFHRFRFLWVP